ncbi:hypothetical protein BGW80DRAFT_1314605 [Lactifluus volemus]|nr:hypothetical protein BGW80DRAFT_1314605 [Lactifluus volemus]
MRRHPDWHVASAVQIFGTLSPIFSVVEELTLSHMAYNPSSGLPAEVYGTQWRKLFRPFSGVKILQMPSAHFGPPWSLHPRNEDIFLEFMPKLLKIHYSKERNTYSPFIERQAFNLCPVCKHGSGRRQELRRHLLSVHLPYWIHCPYSPCSWRGSRMDDFRLHLKGQKCGPDRLERKQYGIYNSHMAIDWIIDRGKPVEEMARYALAVVEERARELGKVEEWSDLWGHTAGRRRNEQRSSLTTAASPPF